MKREKTSRIPAKTILDWLQIEGTTSTLISSSDILSCLNLSKNENEHFKQEFDVEKNLDFSKLGEFLIEHEQDLDKTKLLMKMLYRSYK